MITSWRKTLVEQDIEQCKKCKEYYTNVNFEADGEVSMCRLDDYYIEYILMGKSGCEWFEEKQ